MSGADILIAVVCRLRTHYYLPEQLPSQPPTKFDPENAEPENLYFYFLMQFKILNGMVIAFPSTF
jgi:hypothetical protein